MRRSEISFSSDIVPTQRISGGVGLWVMNWVSSFLGVRLFKQRIFVLAVLLIRSLEVFAYDEELLRMQSIRNPGYFSCLYHLATNKISDYAYPSAKALIEVYRKAQDGNADLTNTARDILRYDIDYQAKLLLNLEGHPSFKIDDPRVATLTFLVSKLLGDYELYVESSTQFLSAMDGDLARLAAVQRKSETHSLENDLGLSRTLNLGKRVSENIEHATYLFRRFRTMHNTYKTSRISLEKFLDENPELRSVANEANPTGVPPLAAIREATLLSVNDLTMTAHISELDAINKKIKEADSLFKAWGEIQDALEAKASLALHASSWIVTRGNQDTDTARAWYNTHVLHETLFYMAQTQLELQRLTIEILLQLRFRSSKNWMSLDESKRARYMTESNHKINLQMNQIILAAEKTTQPVFASPSGGR